MLIFIVSSVIALAVGRLWWLGHWIGRTVVTIVIGGGLAFITIMLAPGSSYGWLVALAALVIGYVIGSSRYWYQRRPRLVQLALLGVTVLIVAGAGRIRLPIPAPATTSTQLALQPPRPCDLDLDAALAAASHGKLDPDKPPCKGEVDLYAALGAKPPAPPPEVDPFAALGISRDGTATNDRR